MDELWWNGTEPLVRGAVIAAVGYVTLLLLLRATGPRTLTKATPLDFIIVVTLGSAFGRTITAPEVSVTQVVVVLVVLVALKWLFAWLRSLSPLGGRLFDHPTVLVYSDDAPLQRALRRHRLTEHDLHDAARMGGHGDLEPVHSILLLKDGTLGVITKDQFRSGQSVTPYVDAPRES